MWIGIITVIFVLTFAVAWFLVSRIRRFRWIQKVAGEKLRNQTLLSVAVAAGCATVVGVVMGGVNLFIVAVYLSFFWLLSDGFVWVLRRCSAKIRNAGWYLAGILALTITVCYLGFAYENAHHVVFTEYTLSTQKQVEPMKIVLITDAHIGATFDGEGFGQYVDAVNELHPDAVMVAGDFIDGGSQEDEIRTAIGHLGRLDSTYGTFFVFGNHDQNHYGEERQRTFTTAQFRAALRESGVHLLEDAAVELPNGYTILGRRDKIDPNRTGISELMQDIPPESFVVDLNHQPNDYDAEQAAGVDLVLSGHTHGGQLWLIRNVGIWIGANDNTYGLEQRGNTSFIVSSGISDWAMDFKTGCRSEIVVVMVTPE